MDNCRVIRKKDIFLCDSGGQYKYGTTDVTRTITFKNQSKKIKNIFTKVLKGHIAVVKTNLNKNKIGKEQFGIVCNQLNDLNMLFKVDLKLIEAYSNSIALHIECEQALREKGRVQVYTDEDGNPKHAQVVPLQSISKSSLDQAIKLASQFGLTPSARTKISSPAKLEIKDNEFNFFND